MTRRTIVMASGSPMVALPVPRWATLYQPFADGGDAGGRSPGAFERLGGLALPTSRPARCGGEYAHHTAYLALATVFPFVLGVG